MLLTISARWFKPPWPFYPLSLEIHQAEPLKGGKRWVNSLIPKRSGDAQVFIWVFLKIGVPQNGWFIIMENAVKMDDLGGKPTILGNPHIYTRQILLNFLAMFQASKGGIPRRSGFGLGLLGLLSQGSPARAEQGWQLKLPRTAGWKLEMETYYSMEK